MAVFLFESSNVLMCNMFLHTHLSGFIEMLANSVSSYLFFALFLKLSQIRGA